MKTSNIIIIAFATFIIGGMLFLFVDAKKHKKEIENNISFKEFPLATFSVVVAEKGTDLHIDQSDSSMIKVEYIKDKKTPSKLYTVINDTLHVYGGLRMFVKCNGINTIVGNKPFWIGVKNLSSDSLTIKMNGGRLYFNLAEMSAEVFSQKAINLGIIANDSAYIEINNASLHNLSVKSNNAKIISQCEVKHLHANLTNNTRFFNLNKIEALIIERDTTSHFELGNQPSFFN